MAETNKRKMANTCGNIFGCCVGKKRSRYKNMNMIPPKIDTTLTKNPLTAKTGESITVTLIVIGDPAPRVDWYINGKIILPGTPRFFFSRQGPKHQLLVQPVTSKEDVIRVVARNWLGMDTYDQRVSFYKVLRKYSTGSTGSISSLSQTEIAPAENTVVHRGKLQLRGGASMPVLNILPAYRSSTSFLNKKGTSSTLVPKIATLDDDELFEPLNKVSRTQSNIETRRPPRRQITVQSASLPRSGSTSRNRDCLDYTPLQKYTTPERRTQSVSQLGSADVSVAIPSPPPVKMNTSPPNRSTIRKSMELIPQSEQIANKQGLASPKPLTNKARHKSEGELRTPKSSPSHKEVSYVTENELELQIETFFTPLEASQSSLGLYKPHPKPQPVKTTKLNTHLPEEVFGTNGIEKYIIHSETKKEVNNPVKKPEVNNNNNPAYKDQERESLNKDMTESKIYTEQPIRKESSVTVQTTIHVAEKSEVKPKGVTFAKYGKFCDDFESFKVEQEEPDKERRTSSPAVELNDSFCLDEDPADAFEELEKAASPTALSGAEVEAAAFRPSQLPSQQTNEGFLETDIDDLIMNIDSPSRERSIKKNNILHSDSDDEDDLSSGSLDDFAKDIEHKERAIVHANRPVSFRVPNSEYFRPTIVETILEEEDTQMLEEENEDKMTECSSVVDSIPETHRSAKLSSSVQTKVEDDNSLISGSDIGRKNDIQELSKTDVCDNIMVGSFRDNSDLRLRGNGCISPKINSSSEEELDTYVDIINNIPAMSPQKNKPNDSVKGHQVLHLSVADDNLNSSSSDIDTDMDSYMVYLASKNENTHKSPSRNTKKNGPVPLSNSSKTNEKSLEPLETDIDSVLELSPVRALNVEASQNTSVTSSDSGYFSVSSQNTTAQQDNVQIKNRNIDGLENKNNSNGSTDYRITGQSSPVRKQNGSVSPGGAGHPGSSSRSDGNGANASSNSLLLDHTTNQKNFLVTENNWEAVTEVFWTNIWSFLLLLTALVIVHLLNPYFTASESTW